MTAGILHIVSIRDCATLLYMATSYVAKCYFTQNQAFGDSRQRNLGLPDCDSVHHSGDFPAVKTKLCFGSQTQKWHAIKLHTMSAKYYTQFRLTDADYRGGNEFSGVVELSRPMDQDCEVEDIEAVLAKNFDLHRNAVKLVSWSRLH